MHFVEEGRDPAPITPRAAGRGWTPDDGASLSRRIQEQEHRLYPEALARVVRGEVRVEGRRVVSAARG